MPVDYISRDGARSMNRIMTDPCLDISSFFFFPRSLSPNLTKRARLSFLDFHAPTNRRCVAVWVASGVLGLRLPGVLKIGKAVSRHTERFP